MIKGLQRQNGISGITIAMIFMLFVTVAAGIIGSILYTGANAGKYASTHIDAAMSGVNSTLQLRDNVVALNSTLNNGNSVGSIQITVGNSGEPADLTPPYIIDENGAVVPDPAVTPTLHIVYRDDDNVLISNCAWTVSFLNSEHRSKFLGNGEKAVITVWLHQWDGSAWEYGEPPYLGEYHIDQYHYFSLQLKPDKGIALDLVLTTPENLRSVNHLY